MKQTKVPLLHNKAQQPTTGVSALNLDLTGSVSCSFDLTVLALSPSG